MSDASYHGFSIFDPAGFVAATAPNVLRQLGLTDEMIQSSRLQASNPSKPTSVQFPSRAYWFPEAVKRLLDASNASLLLRFLSDERWGEEHPEGDCEYWPETTRQTVIFSTEEMLRTADGLEALLEWCCDNPALALQAVWGSSQVNTNERWQNLLTARENMSKMGEQVLFFEDTDEEFLLCGVLATVPLLLRRAVSKGMWFSYSSTRYVGAW